MEEGIPLLLKKFKENIASSFPRDKNEAIAALFLDRRRLEAMPVCDFMKMFIA